MHDRFARAIAVSLFALAPTFAAPPAHATMPTPWGDVAPEVRQAAGAGLFALPRTLVPGAQAALGVQSEWYIPVVMVSFSDDTLVYSAAAFDSALFDTTHAMPTGSVYDYYQWASEGRMRVRGRVVGRVKLNYNHHFYGANGYGLTGSDTPNNMYGALKEALDSLKYRPNGGTDWSQFDNDHDGYVDMLWLVHAGRAGEMSGDRDDFWSITSRMSAGWRNGGAFLTRQLLPGTTDLYYRIDRFSSMPEISGFRPGARAEIGVFCHEFGHALGLPDLYDTSTFGSLRNVGPGYWSLMSTGGYGGNGSSPEYPTHLGGWCSSMLGWRQVIRPTRDTTVTLTPLPSGGPLIEFWFQGQSNPEHFLLECRSREGFDRTLNNGGLIITHVDEAQIGSGIPANRINAGLTPGMWVVEADGDSDLVVGRNRGDAYDPFPGLAGVHDFNEATVPAAVTFTRATPGIALSDIQRLGNNVRFNMRVRPEGWLPATDETRGPFAPIPSQGVAPTAVMDAIGDLHQVRSELVAGRSQVVLRSRVRGIWQDPLVLTDSPTGAFDPALTLLGDRDLALAWSDLRGGRARVWYRTRLGGTWGTPQVVGDLPGENRAPAVGADRRGRVHLAWLNTLNDAPTVVFERFLYFAPWAQPVRLTDTLSFPGPPLVAVSRSGTSHVIWPDRRVAPYRLYFSRFNPDTGLSRPLTLTTQPAGSQGPAAAYADSAGTLHVVWVSNNLTGRQLRYERRPLTGEPSPRDSVIESRGASVERIALSGDPAGTLHLVYDSAPNLVPQVFYKRWRPKLGWDVYSTEVTTGEEGGASYPSVLATLPGTVNVLYAASLGGESRFMVRRRQIEPQEVLAADEPEPLPREVLAFGPNPLRAGSGLDLRWEGADGENVIDLYDLGGRRVASTTATVTGQTRFAHIAGDRTRLLPSGVYFVRPRGWSGAGRRLVVLQ